MQVDYLENVQIELPVFKLNEKYNKNMWLLIIN